MNVPIRRFDTAIPLPDYKTKGAAAMDCAARERVVIPAQGIGYVPLNIALQLPEGFWVLMAARSSLHKRGLMLANGIGVFDQDFSGDVDEYKAALYNFTTEPVAIEKGDRVTQIVVVPHIQIEWIEQDALGNAARGGFGTTGI